MPARETKLQHRLFQVGVILKGVDGVTELGLAILLFVFGQRGLTSAAVWLTTRVSSDTMRLWLADHLVRHAQTMAAGSVHLVAGYLLVQGGVKLWLVQGLLREKRWVFVPALVIMVLLIAAVIVQEVEHPGVGLHVLLVLNVIITLLIWREWMDLRA